ncbi:MAG: hypothetical protein AAGM38_13135 [Pseudomonadota bacterium]
MADDPKSGDEGSMAPDALTQRLEQDPEFQRALEQARKGEADELEAALRSEESFLSWLGARFPWAQGIIHEIMPIAPALMQHIATLIR